MSLFAQILLTGAVSDTDGHLMVGVIVYSHGYHDGTVADTNGFLVLQQQRAHSKCS